jgi:hypothetical protein
VTTALRFVALAALLVGLAGAVLLAASQTGTAQEGTGAVLCADIADYGVPGQAPPAPTMGPMPSVGPGETPSTGVLQPGEVAVLGDADGPGARLRIGDVRICDRYPTARPTWDGMRYVVVRMELLVDRSGFVPVWVGGAYHLWLRREDDAFPLDRSEAVFGVPGVVRRSSLVVPAGFESVTDLVYAVPAAEEARLFLDYRPAGDEDLRAPVTLSWDLGMLPGSALGEPRGPWVTVPDGPVTTGRIAADEVAVVEQGGIRFGVRAGRVDEVQRYPGLDPTRGRFVEVQVGYGSGSGVDIPGAGLTEWRAVTGAGEELEIRRLGAGGPEEDILVPHLTAASGMGWLVIDAPPDGQVVLEYRRGGESPVLFEVLVREG